jgi:hypothetical protein
MKQEDKELLLKDLCARLPYGVICHTEKGNGHLCSINQTIFGTEYGINIKATERDYFNDREKVIKSYLRPMSSMTEEEFENLKEYSGLKYDQLDLASFQNGTYKCLDFYLSEVPSYVVILVFDWLNKNHFDYRGLIPKGLAIAVNKNNNPYKNHE